MEYRAEFPVLYSRSLLIIYFQYCILLCTYQCQTPNLSPTLSPGRKTDTRWIDECVSKCVAYRDR